MRLGVNIDHVATLRQARRGAWPDPVEAARACEQAGADSIVCHLREDRRHIQDQDVRRLNASIATRLNLEMSVAPSVVKTALAVKPAQVTLVPERRQELTTEGGLDVRKLSKKLTSLLRSFESHGIEASLFVDPVAGQLRAARDAGARIVELHTGRYANAKTAAARARGLETLAQATRLGKQLGLVVAAGHGLDYDNIGPITEIRDIEEANIGYAIIVRALWVGLEEAVKEMTALLSSRTPHPAGQLHDAHAR